MGQFACWPIHMDLNTPAVCGLASSSHLFWEAVRLPRHKENLCLTLSSWKSSLQTQQPDSLFPCHSSHKRFHSSSSQNLIVLNNKTTSEGIGFHLPVSHTPEEENNTLFPLRKVKSNCNAITDGLMVGDLMQRRKSHLHLQAVISVTGEYGV